MGTPRKLETVSTAILLACAVVITGLLVKREFAAPPDPTKPTVQKAWRKLASSGQLVANDSGRVQLTIFSDFQCPFCRSFAPELDSLIAEYPGRLRVVFRHYPLERIHKDARETAIASECAAAQGQFKAFHDVAFRNQDSLGLLPPVTLAARAGVIDSGAFIRCLSSAAADARIREDISAGEAAGVTVTPTLIINQWQMKGAIALDTLRRLINQEFKRGS